MFDACKQSSRYEIPTFPGQQGSTPGILKGEILKKDEAQVRKMRWKPSSNVKPVLSGVSGERLKGLSRNSHQASELVSFRAA